MGNIPIGLGMYTVYNDVLADMAATFKNLAKLGYDGIEFYGEPEYDIDTVKRALDVSGLKLISWHIEWRNVQPDTLVKTTKYLKAVGCTRAIVPCLGGKWNVAHTAAEERRGLWEDYTIWMNALAMRLLDNGMSLGYHNHEHEFMLKYDGERVFDILFQRLEPNIIMEFDTGNAIEGGADPVEELKKYKGRPVLLHCKPFSTKNGFNTVLGTADDLNDWKEIAAVCKTDCIAMLVESESTVGSGMENAKACIEGLKRFL
jgi:sugar phosphate isomerase/epimerase